MKKICFITTTRADWGLLKPLADSLRHHSNIRIQIIASNMHLNATYGATATEIESDGFDIDARIPLPDGDTPCDRAKATGICTAGVAEALEQLKPDAVVALGDRYEMLGAVSAAAVMNIPVIHIAGGEISIGAIDDAIRHSITKLSSFHLTATEAYRQRVIQMGENPDRVINTGAIGVWNAMNVAPLPINELEDFLQIQLSDRDTILLTFHPATMDISSTTAAQTDELLCALDNFPHLQIIITYPNNDAGSEDIISRLEAFANRNHDRVRLVKSLGMKRYISLLHYVKAVVGNSSSGIVEVPSAKIPTVNIGIRQQGRIAAESVLHCAAECDDIIKTTKEALSEEFQQFCKTVDNPYFQQDTLSIMTQSIISFVESLPHKPKIFYDLPL